MARFGADIPVRPDFPQKHFPPDSASVGADRSPCNPVWPYA